MESKKTDNFEVFRFPQFLLLRTRTELNPGTLHEFMKLISLEMKSIDVEALKFVALDLQQKFELNRDFFRVCRALLTYFKQTKIKFVALNATDATKELLIESGMSRFVVAISSAHLAEMQRAERPRAPLEDRDVYLTQVWGKKVSELISQLSPGTRPCEIAGEATRHSVDDFGSHEVMASGNLTLDAESFYLSISVKTKKDLDAFKTCSTYPSNSTSVTPENWIHEFINIAMRKVLRDLTDQGYAVTCDVPGPIDYSRLANYSMKPLSVCSLEFNGLEFSCVCGLMRSGSLSQNEDDFIAKAS